MIFSSRLISSGAKFKPNFVGSSDILAKKEEDTQVLLQMEDNAKAEYLRTFSGLFACMAVSKVDYQ